MNVPSFPELERVHVFAGLWRFCTNAGVCLLAHVFASASEVALPREGEIVKVDAVGATVAGRLDFSYGDSFTAGYGASDPETKGYVPLVAAATKWALRAVAMPGRHVQDIAAWTVYPTVVTPASHFTTLTGLNDMRFYGSNPVALETYRRTLLACLTWLAIPHASKVIPGDPAISITGAWAPVTLYGKLSGCFSSEPGATLRAKVSGTTIYVGYTSRAAMANGGVFTVAVDGVTRATIDTSVGVNSGQPVGTSWPELVRIAGLRAGAHSVVLTVQAGAGTSYVNIDWLGGNGGLAGSLQPLVLAGNTVRLSAAGFALSAEHGYNHGSTAAQALYNDVHRQICRDLRADGLHVFPVDVAAAYDPDAANIVNADGVHPADPGHAQIAAAFIAAVAASAREWSLVGFDPRASAAGVVSVTQGSPGAVTTAGTLP